MLTVYLKPNSKKPMYEQLYSFLKDEIKKGNLKKGEKLPSSRALSSHLGISRSTVDTAYQQLVAEGYIIASPKRGYFIAEIDKLLNIVPIAHMPSFFDMPEKEPDMLYDFAPVANEIENFPDNVWRRLSRECINYDNGSLFLDNDAKGSKELRQKIAQYLRANRGIITDAEHIILGAGSQYLLMLLFRLFKQGSLVAMENPAYTTAYKTIEALGLSICPANVDEGGMSIEYLEKSEANIAYVTPSHQFPTGIVMPITRRAKLLNWANYNPGRYIIEDDYDSEFRYQGKPIPALLSMDKSDRVVYLGTFSKALSSAIRMSYMVLPDELLNAFNSLFRNFSCTVSKLDMAIMTKFINGGDFERHINRLRNKYRIRHDALIKALKQFGENAVINSTSTGSSLLLEWRGEMDSEALVKAAKEKGIKLYPLESYTIGSYLVQYPTFVMGYVKLDENEIAAAIKELVQIFR
ncbi:MAG: PLP-dependent aminotransferase family protein [Lachnospiraceae bacterium]|nr:PLP-dependent aminotransferase family protein [Lachnospiraceae bacterium]